MSFEAYSVGIRLHLIDGISLGILGLSEKFVGLNTVIGKTRGHLTEFESKLKGIKNLMLGGTALMAGGGVALSLLDGPIKAANEYELAFTKLKTLNLGDAVNTQADAFARANSTMLVSSTQMMNVLSESVGLFGSYAEAQKHAAQLSQLSIANSTIFAGKIGAMDEGSVRGLMKFMDRRGALGGDEALYQRTLNLGEKIVTGSGGFIKFADLAAFSQMGGTAFRALSDEGLMNMSLLIQEQGGAKAATALMSGYQNLVAGRTPVKTMYKLADLGLVTLGEVTHGTVGGKQSKSVVVKDLKDSALYESNPTEWYRTTFLGALAKGGITDTPSILKWTNDLLSNRLASNQGSIMDTQTLQIIRDATLTKNALGADAVIKQLLGGPTATFMDLQTKKNNLEIEFGEAALPVLIPILQGLTPVVKSLASLIKDFPKSSSALIYSFVGLAGLSLAGGAIMNIVGGMKLLRIAFVGMPAVVEAAAGAGGIGGITGMLVGMVKGIGSAAGAIPGIGLLAKGAAVVGVGAAAYEATDLIANKWLHVDEKLGNLFNTLVNGKYDPNVPAAKPSNFIGVKGSSASTLAVHTQINLDGRKIADTVSQHQANDLTHSTGGELFDPTLTLPSVGLNFAK